jgi:hypothetical protein
MLTSSIFLGLLGLNSLVTALPAVERSANLEKRQPGGVRYPVSGFYTTF